MTFLILYNILAISYLVYTLSIRIWRPWIALQAAKASRFHAEGYASLLTLETEGVLKLETQADFLVMRLLFRSQFIPMKGVTAPATHPGGPIGGVPQADLLKSIEKFLKNPDDRISEATRKCFYSIFRRIAIENRKQFFPVVRLIVDSKIYFPIRSQNDEQTQEKQAIDRLVLNEIKHISFEKFLPAPAARPAMAS